MMEDQSRISMRRTSLTKDSIARDCSTHQRHDHVQVHTRVSPYRLLNTDNNSGCRKYKSMLTMSSRILQVIILAAIYTDVCCNPDAKRLYENLLLNNGYNKLIRPVDNNSDTLTVYLGLKLSQLIDVDEKNQIMTTNVWLKQDWWDTNLKWTPRDYGGIQSINVWAPQLWLPDIVLFNNADGNYEVTLMTKATLHYTGKVIWEPPAIYKSSCTIDVEFFPFDEQQCTMKFGSWTYDGFQVDLLHILQLNHTTKGQVEIDYGIDMDNFYESVEWDVLTVPAKRNEKFYPCCQEPFPDITFNITLRRKTLFYTVNLIIPCVAISFLTVLVFYLPSDSGEKITLCISILLSLTVFFLLLAEIIPPTSLVVPLVGKYLLFTMILVTLSIIVTVVVLNVHFRSPATHTMSPWVRKVFLNILPRLLLMRRPKHHKLSYGTKVTVEGPDGNREVRQGTGTTEVNNPNSSIYIPGPGGGGLLTESISGSLSSAQRQYKRFSRDYYMSTPHGAILAESMAHSSASYTLTNGLAMLRHNTAQPKDKSLKAEIEAALDGVRFIADHLKMEDEQANIKEDWKFVAMVLDRLFLWVFTIACIMGTFGIILQAPTLYDKTLPLKKDQLPKSYEITQVPK